MTDFTYSRNVACIHPVSAAWVQRGTTTSTTTSCRIGVPRSSSKGGVARFTGRLLPGSIGQDARARPHKGECGVPLREVQTDEVDALDEAEPRGEGE